MSVRKVHESGGVDKMLLVPALILTGIGLLMVYSASAFFAQEKTGDQFLFLKKQAIAAILGAGLMWLAIRVDYRKLIVAVIPAYIGALLLLVLVFVPGLGIENLGARRWIRLGGFTLQPSEFAKLAFVLYLAWALSRLKNPAKTAVSNLLKLVIPALILLGIIVIEPDFGTVAILVLVGFGMFYVAGTSVKYLLYSILIALGAAIPLVLFFPYRLERIKAFLKGLSFIGSVGDYSELCYQVRESIISFGSGRIWGMGLGQGKHKMFFIPQVHSDFILATVGQEGGFVLVSAVLLLYGVFIYAGFRTAWRSSDPFAAYLAFGITTMLALQVFINAGVVMGIVPPKGIVLPFMSYGGSALMATFLATGILLKLSAQARAKRIE